MELQLGLSLPFMGSHESSNCKNLEFDHQEIQKKKKKMKKVGLMNPWSYNKRSFEDAFGGEEMSIEEDDDDDHQPNLQTLPLLLWSGQPNDDEGENGEKKHLSCNINKNDEKEEYGEVVGWPPIKSWRKKVLQRQQGENIIIRNNNNYEMGGGGGGGGGGANSMYVKVKMEGVAITRKIDLSLFHSYQTLTNSLLTMFANKRGSQTLDKEDKCYTLTYQDKEGDWLLAGDVPWQTFIQCVRRLEMIRND